MDLPAARLAGRRRPLSQSCRTRRRAPTSAPSIMHPALPILRCIPICAAKAVGPYAAACAWIVPCSAAALGVPALAPPAAPLTPPSSSTCRLAQRCASHAPLLPPRPLPVPSPPTALPASLEAGAQPSVLNPPPPPRSHLEVVAGEVEGGEGGQRGQGRALRGTGRWTAGAIRGAREGSNGGRAGWQCATPDRYFVKPIKYLYESLDIL